MKAGLAYLACTDLSTPRGALTNLTCVILHRLYAVLGGNAGIAVGLAIATGDAGTVCRAERVLVLCFELFVVTVGGLVAG